MKPKYSYSVETCYLEKWIKLFNGSRDFCEGYLHRAYDDRPRLAKRIMRSDGKVMVELKADDDVCIGMIAGWPTPEQYEYAAQRALDQAARIRKQQEKQNK